MEYGLIGEKLGHSYSKIIHEKLASYTYELMPLSREEFPVFMEEKKFKGINVTIPYKKDVIPYLEEMDSSARAIGAVNTIINRDGHLCGYNTDCPGFQYMMKQSQVDPAHKKVLVLGTGGAAQAIVAALHMGQAAQVVSVSRTGKGDAITYEDCIKNHTDARIIVNTTPVGMFPHADASPLDLTPFHSCEAVLDVIYNPAETRLTAQARSLGMKAATGLTMLVAQAKYACELFLGEALPDSLITEIVEELQNV
jgi:shikimate dehydrogenase